MPEAVIAVAEGKFRFDLDALSAAVHDRWPHAVFVPASGRMATVSHGQFQIPDASSRVRELLVEVDPSGRALDLDCPADDLAAEFIACATSLASFPDDGSVILAEWAAEFVALGPSMSPEAVLRLREL